MLDDFKGAFDICEAIVGPEDYREACIREVTVYIQGVYPTDFVNARATCELPGTEAHRTTCYTYTAFYMKRYDDRKTGIGEQFCAEAPSYVREICLEKVSNSDTGYPTAPAEDSL